MPPPDQIPPLPRSLRGKRIDPALICPPGPEAETIAAQLARLGNPPEPVWPIPARLPSRGLLVIHLDPGQRERLLSALPADPGAIVVSVDPKQPGIIDDTIALGAHGLLFRPLRPESILPQITIALYLHRQHGIAVQKQQQAEDKLRNRRMVERAVALLAAQMAIPNDSAYAELRNRAMRQRGTIEDLARRIVGEAGGGERGPGLRPGAGLS